jgi:thermitase
MSFIYRSSIGAVVVCASVAVIASAAVTPDDPYYSSQWYSNTMGMPDAWEISTGSSSVVAAVLDTGVISTTPDLLDRILSPLSAVPGQAPLTDAWMTDTTQSALRRHGTWVASAIGMTINNGLGGAGMGNFSILPIRITSESITVQDSWIAAGIILAADNGAKVINISYYATDYALLDSAAAYARSKGALTFIGGGNTNRYRDIDDYANLIFVAGTNQSDGRWSEWMEDANGVDRLVGSSWGAFVDLAAPAQDILLADPTMTEGYGTNSGTSFATPLAAGAAALAWSINPNLTPDEVEQLLRLTAVDLGDPGWDQIYGWGRIDVAALAQAAYLTIPEPMAWVMLLTGTVVFIRRRRRI